MFWAGNMKLDGVELVKREKVCALEVWCECFGGNKGNIRKQDSVEINNILANLEGWERNKSKRRYGYCGIQRGFNVNFGMKIDRMAEEKTGLNDNEILK